MNRGQLKARFKLLVPSAKKSAVPTATLELLLDEGVEQVNQVAKIFKIETDFNSEVGKQTYKLSEDVPNYSGIAKGGVWIDDSNSKAVRAFPKTREWFDDNFQNWWEASNAIPQYYFIEGDDLTFETPYSAVRNIRIWHLRKTVSMSSDTRFPWSNGSIEIVAFRPLDNAIVAYAIREVQHALGKSGDWAAKNAEYRAKLILGMRRVRRRPDFLSDFSAEMTIAP